MGCKNGGQKIKPEKDYDRNLFKERKLSAGVVISKTSKGIEAGVQIMTDFQKVDSYKIIEK